MSRTDSRARRCSIGGSHSGRATTSFPFKLNFNYTTFFTTFLLFSGTSFQLASAGNVDIIPVPTVVSECALTCISELSAYCSHLHPTGLPTDITKCKCLDRSGRSYLELCARECKFGRKRANVKLDAWSQGGVVQVKGGRGRSMRRTIDKRADAVDDEKNVMGWWAEECKEEMATFNINTSTDTVESTTPIPTTSNTELQHGPTTTAILSITTSTDAEGPKLAGLAASISAIVSTPSSSSSSIPTPPPATPDTPPSDTLPSLEDSASTSPQAPLPPDSTPSSESTTTLKTKVTIAGSSLAGFSLIVLAAVILYRRHRHHQWEEYAEEKRRRRGNKPVVFGKYSHSGDSGSNSKNNTSVDKLSKKRKFPLHMPKRSQGRLGGLTFSRQKSMSSLSSDMSDAMGYNILGGKGRVPGVFGNIVVRGGEVVGIGKEVLRGEMGETGTGGQGREKRIGFGLGYGGGGNSAGDRDRGGYKNLEEVPSATKSKSKTPKTGSGYGLVEVVITPENYTGRGYGSDSDSETQTIHHDKHLPRPPLSPVNIQGRYREHQLRGLSPPSKALPSPSYEGGGEGIMPSSPLDTHASAGGYQSLPEIYLHPPSTTTTTASDHHNNTINRYSPSLNQQPPLPLLPSKAQREFEDVDSGDMGLGAGSTYDYCGMCGGPGYGCGCEKGGWV